MPAPGPALGLNCRQPAATPAGGAPECAYLRRCAWFSVRWRVGAAAAIPNAKSRSGRSATAKLRRPANARADFGRRRSEEHTSELQSRGHLVCRLLLEKKQLVNGRK